MKKHIRSFAAFSLILLSTCIKAQSVTVTLNPSQAQHFEAVQDNTTLAYLSISAISNSNLYNYTDATSPYSFHKSYHRYKFTLPAGVAASDVTSITVSYAATVTSYNINTLIWNTIPNSSCNGTGWTSPSLQDYENIINCMDNTTTTINQLNCSNVGSNPFSQTITSASNAALLAGILQNATNFTIAMFVDNSFIGQTTSTAPTVSLIYNTHPISNNTISSTSSSFVCSGTPTTLTGSTPTGGNPGSYTYQWQSSTSSSGPWTNVGTGINYTPTAAISQTTYYRRVVSSSPQPASTSNVITIAVNPPAAPTGVSMSSTQSANTLQISWNTSIGATSYQVVNCANNTATTISSSPYVISGLTAATTYQYSVKAVCSGGTSAASPCASATTLSNISNNTICCNQTQTGAQTPALLTGTIPIGGTGAYTYSWESSLTGTGSWSSIGITTQNYTPSSTITQTTYYRRNAISGTQTLYSNTVAVTVTAPATPTGVNISVQSSSSLLLSWTSSAGATGYNIYNCSTNALVATVNAPATSYLITGLNSYTNYQYYMTSICGSTLSSPISACVSGTTLSNPIANNSISSNASFVCSATSYNISGTAPTGGNNTSYTFQWQISTDNVTWINIAGTSGTGSNYTETSIITQTTYYRRIVNSSPFGPNTSNTVTITIGQPATPSGIILFSTSSTSLQMNWNASAGATFYQIIDCSSGNITTVNAPLTTVTISGLSSATQYQFKIVACCNSLSSAPSACFSGTPGACYANAGLAVTDQNISCCGGCTTNGVQIGTTPPVSGLTYQWSPAANLVCSTCPTTITKFCSSALTVGYYTLTVSGTSCATSTSVVSVRTSSYTGTTCCRLANFQEENLTIEHSAFFIYPNPANNQLTVSLYDYADYVKIIDVTGRIVFETKNVTLSELKVDVSNYTQGLYFVIAKIGDIVEKKKLIVE